MKQDKKQFKYQIKYNYITGNSFETSTEEDILELEFNDLEVAEANLKRIEEHYRQYKQLENCRGKDPYQILELNKDKDWFVNEPRYYISRDNITNIIISESEVQKCKDLGYEIKITPDLNLAQNTIILYTDDNKPYQFWCPWCGYFETLYSAEIISKQPNFRKIEF